jgi:hypothetical protein
VTNTHNLRQVNKRHRRKKIAIQFGLLAVLLIGLPCHGWQRLGADTLHR